MTRQTQKNGFTLIEVVVASSIMVLLFMILFEGMMVCQRIVYENQCRLEADAFAWDLLWKTHNLSDSSITNRVEVRVPIEDADVMPRLSASNETLTYSRMITRSGNLWDIVVDVEWGNRSLDNSGTLETSAYHLRRSAKR